MATESARIAATLGALLGQSFSILSGQPKFALTAESFHGTVCTFARRTGLVKLMEKRPILYEDVKDSNAAILAEQWHDWAKQEVLRRYVRA